MKHHCAVLAIFAATAVVACTTVDQQPNSSQSRQDRVYTTGSRIPVRDSAGSADVRSVDNQGATEIMNSRGVNMPGKGGAN